MSKGPNTQGNDQRPSPIRGFESSLPIALLRARKATAEKFKVHTDAEGLTQPQWRVIRALAAGVPLDVGTISTRCALLQPSVSRILKSLSDRGLVQTISDPVSRRRELVLTPDGLCLFEKIAAISEAVYRDIENAYGRDELEKLVKMLNRLREVAEAMPALPLPREVGE